MRENTGGAPPVPVCPWLWSSLAGSPAEAADAERSVWPGRDGAGREIPLRLPDVLLGVLVHRRDARDVPGLEGGEGHRQPVAQLEPGAAAEVGEALALFLGHVVAVGHVHRGDRRKPLAGARLVPGDRGDRVPDVVVVVDRIQRFRLGARRAARADAHRQQLGVEDRLLGGGVHLEERGQPGPYRFEGAGVGGVDLLEDREEPALFVVVVQDQLGDVQGSPPFLSLAYALRAGHAGRGGACAASPWACGVSSLAKGQRGGTMARAPETRFTRSGDVDIAYQVFGGGERDIVMTMGWVTHLEVMWELPELAYFLERLASLGRVIIFDKRGTGLSDRVPGMVTLEQRAEDGGAVGAMFAATNPERISALVLSAMAFVTTPGAIEADPATMQMMWDAIENGWGSGSLLDLAAPRHAADPRLRTWWRRWERQSATPNAAATLLRWGAEIDLRPVFAAVQTPTLFLERAGAGMINQDSVRAAAGLAPCGRYVEIPGEDVLPFLGDPDPMLGEIAEFLTGARGDVDPDRTLSTVLFTDIVGSTAKADEVGDRAWRNILDSHHSAVRAALARFGGTEIDTAG